MGPIDPRLSDLYGLLLLPFCVIGPTDQHHFRMEPTIMPTNSPVKPHYSLRTLGAAAGGLAVFAAISIVFAGPLNPPPGPVTSTYKTLTEVEPRIALSAANTPSNGLGVFAINQPGSYYLTENLVGVVGRYGIVIGTTGAVTIDLNGYEILGPGGTGVQRGIASIGVVPASVTVRNGTIRNWPSDGIDLSSITTPSCTFIDLHVRNNGERGIATGPGATFISCIADDNGTIGLATGSGSTFNNCVALSNTTDGFLLGSGSTITGCTAYLNGDDGIVTNNGCTVSACTSYANTGDGIEVGSGCIVSNNTCDRNGFNAGNGAGIRMSGSDNRVDSNNCTNADRGVEASAPGNLIIRNTCSSNVTNWVFVAGNSFGEIKLSNSAISPAVSTNGNFAGTFVTTDPYANISY